MAWLIPPLSDDADFELEPLLVEGYKLFKKFFLKSSKATNFSLFFHNEYSHFWYKIEELH